MGKTEKRGAEVLGQMQNDPIGRFLIRLIGPGARREISRIESKVSGLFGDVTNAFLDAEGISREKKKQREVVVEAEIIENPPPKK